MPVYQDSQAMQHNGKLLACSKAVHGYLYTGYQLQQMIIL